MDRVNGADWFDIGGGKRGFRGQNAGLGIPGTEVTDDFLNDVQENILHVIEQEGLAPATGQWNLLYDAIRRAGRRTEYVADTGTTNNIVINPAPAVLALFDGLSFTVKVNNTNTGAMSVNCSGLGSIDLCDSNGAAVTAGEVTANELVRLTYRTPYWRLQRYSSTASATQRGLTKLATGAETITGTENAKAVTPAGLAALTSTTARRGLIEIATGAEGQALTDVDRALTPGVLATITASPTTWGITRHATNAEAKARTLDTRAVTPANLAAMLGVGWRGVLWFPGVLAGGTYGFNPATYGLTSDDKMLVLLWGGGGGGASITGSQGAGGGAGGCGIGIFDAQAATITLGPGGAANNAGGNAGAGSASTFGALMTANGGGGGGAGPGGGGGATGGMSHIIGGGGGDIINSGNYWADGGSSFWFGTKGVNTGGFVWGAGGPATTAAAYDGNPGACMVIY